MGTPDVEATLGEFTRGPERTAFPSAKKLRELESLGLEKLNRGKEERVPKRKLESYPSRVPSWGLWKAPQLWPFSCPPYFTWQGKTELRADPLTKFSRGREVSAIQGSPGEGGEVVGGGGVTSGY